MASRANFGIIRIARILLGVIAVASATADVTPIEMLFLVRYFSDGASLLNGSEVFLKPFEFLVRDFTRSEGGTIEVAFLGSTSSCELIQGTAVADG